MREPLIHSGIEDCLPEDHPLAWTVVGCEKCEAMLHAGSPVFGGNECMQPWVETGKGNYCLSCFVPVFLAAEAGEEFALPD